MASLVKRRMRRNCVTLFPATRTVCSLYIRVHQTIDCYCLYLNLEFLEKLFDSISSFATLVHDLKICRFLAFLNNLWRLFWRKFECFCSHPRNRLSSCDALGDDWQMCYHTSIIILSLNLWSIAFSSTTFRTGCHGIPITNIRQEKSFF